MGLDQYLVAELLVLDTSRAKPELVSRQSQALSEIRKIIADAINMEIPDEKSFGLFEIPGTVTVTFNVAYWRKANQIHKWFDNEAGGLENCQEYEVEVEKLQELVTLCERLLEERNFEEALEELPTEGGFFFGPTDKEDYYWDDLEETVKQLKPLLANDYLVEKASFKYHGWW